MRLHIVYDEDEDGRAYDLVNMILGSKKLEESDIKKVRLSRKPPIDSILGF